MSLSKILLQLDTDAHPSVFDAVVAADSGIQHIFRHGGVTPKEVTGLVHGTIFTRGLPELVNTAIFVGGSDIAAGEAVFEQVRASFFGPFRVSVMLDSGGSNTTAAAAVVTAGKHAPLEDSDAVLLGATGPVGRRCAHLLAAHGSPLMLVSRELAKADQLKSELESAHPKCQGQVRTLELANLSALKDALGSAQSLISCGAAGAMLMDAATRESAKNLKVAIDLNATPPLGLEGIEPSDKAKLRGETVCYGALGVGGLKMKIHKAALTKMFAVNDAVLDLNAIFALAQSTLG